MEVGTAVREQLAAVLAWQDAHVGFDKAVAGIPVEARGKRPPGLPYSAWQLLEHMRIAQRDILEFCQDPNYRELNWPDDYWPHSPEPPDAGAWDESLRQFREDRAAMQAIATGTGDLLAKIPHGTGQTYLREVLLVADHNAYHVGELVLLRRLLGNWP
jgi:DinB superfamily